MNAHDRVGELLDTFGVPGASAAQLLCDRHPGDNIAFTVIAADLGLSDITYSELRGKSARFAAALSSLGVRRGDHVPTGEIPNDASPLVVVAHGEAFGYDVAFSQMAAGTGAFAQDELAQRIEGPLAALEQEI